VGTPGGLQHPWCGAGVETFCYNIKIFHFGIFTCKSYFVAAEAFLVLAEPHVDNSILVKMKLKTISPLRCDCQT
jgi:hypothetical protein